MDFVVMLFVILACFAASRRTVVQTEKTYWWRAVLESRHPLKRENSFFGRYMREYPHHQRYISLGAHLAVRECRRLFKYNRWNCNTNEQHIAKPFGKIVEIGCRETAFLYAITSAGLVYNMIKACSQGRIPNCHNRCQESDPKNLQQTHLHNRTHSLNNACDDNFHFGYNVWKDFVFKSEASSDIRARFNLRNSQVGMQDVISRDSTELVCRCHGVSGSCVIHICSQKVVSRFEIIGQKIYDRYTHATREEPDQKAMEIWAKNIMNKNQDRNTREPSRSHFPSRTRTITSRRIRVPRNQDDTLWFQFPKLEYFEDSPDFCPKSEYGVGTTNRSCKPYVSDDQRFRGERSCGEICCYGQAMRTVKRVERSNCKFVYCCEVLCDENERLRDEFYCQ